MTVLTAGSKLSCQDYCIYDSGYSCGLCERYENTEYYRIVKNNDSIEYRLQKKSVWNDGESPWTNIDYSLSVIEGLDDTWALEALKSWCENDMKKKREFEPEEDCGLVMVKYRILKTKEAEIINLNSIP